MIKLKELQNSDSFKGLQRYHNRRNYKHLQTIVNNGIT